MKLATHLTFRLSALFLIILMIWSVIYFFMQMYEIHDGIDEGLDNLKHEFLLQVDNDPEFVEVMVKHNPLNIIVKEISYKEAIETNEKHITTKVYFETEKEDEEVRLLQTAFKCESNGKYYSLKLFTSTVETDDLIENMLCMLIALWLTLGLLLIVAGKKIIENSSASFNLLLSRLQQFRLNRSEMIELPQTNISEFQDLNSTVEVLLKENIQAYKEQKNFIENASHELQTPLAIINSKIELLINDCHTNEEQIKELTIILANLSRMKRLNNSLLLLSKIKNKQFAETSEVNLSEVIQEVGENFNDIIEHKNISLNIRLVHLATTVTMNPDLAHVMINNLIKNAINYNIKNGKIDITLTNNSLSISNDGKELEKGVDIFQRYSSLNDSTGLGLSIVTSILALYNFKIEYSYTGKHNIVIFF